MTLTLPAPHQVVQIQLEQRTAARGITMSELSITTGVPLTDLQRLAAGEAEAVRFSTLVTLCTALECTIDDLIQTAPAPSTHVRAALSPRVPERWRLIGGVTTLSGVMVWVLTVLVSSVNPVDFLVYRYGAAAALAGANIYEGNLTGPMMPPGGLPFTYTPFAALALSPTTLLPPMVAFALWSMLTMCTLAWVIWRCVPASAHQHRNRLLALVVSGFSIVVASHIIFGQINIFLMVLCLFDTLRQPQCRLARFIPGGLLVGLAAAIKLTPALFIVYFLVAKQWRHLCWSIAGAGIGTLLAAAILPEMTWTFFSETIWHLSDQVDLGGLFATSGNSSIQGALAYLGAPRSIGALLAVGVAAGGLWAALIAYRDQRNELHAAVIVGLTACLASPVSWMHHWVYLSPALILLARSPNRPHRIFAAVSAVVLLATGPHLGDVLLASQLEVLWPTGFALRESLVIIGIISISLLSRKNLRPDVEPIRDAKTRKMRATGLGSDRH